MSGGFIQVQEPAGTCWPGTTVVLAKAGKPAYQTSSSTWSADVPAQAGSHVDTARVWSSLADGSISNPPTCNMEVHRDYPGVCSSGTPASGGRTEMSDFEIVKYPDQMTLKFFTACVTGATVKRIIVQIPTAGGSLTYVLSDNNISSHNVRGPSRFENCPLEIIKVIYTKIQIFAPGNIPSFWNVQTNSNKISAGDNFIFPTQVGTSEICAFV
jgi:hypothetical protein